MKEVHVLFVFFPLFRAVERVELWSHLYTSSFLPSLPQFYNIVHSLLLYLTGKNKGHKKLQYSLIAAQFISLALYWHHRNMTSQNMQMAITLRTVKYFCSDKLCYHFYSLCINMCMSMHKNNQTKNPNDPTVSFKSKFLNPNSFSVLFFFFFPFYAEEGEVNQYSGM